MNFLRKNWQVVGIAAVALIITVVLAGMYAVQSKTTQTIERTTTFFDVPVHVVLPNNNYVKSYGVQTNDKVNLRSLLAFNDIATFSQEEILRVNEYDAEQKLNKSFEASTEAPFYIRVVAKEKTLLSYYQNLIEPTTKLPDTYLAKNGIEIIIEQPYYNETQEKTLFLTSKEIQASLQAKAIQFAEMTGYYDEFGNWIEEVSTEDEEWTLDLNDLTTICSANQELVDGVCQPKNSTLGETEEEVTPDEDYSGDTGSNDVVTPNPTPTPTPTPNPTPTPTCGANEQLVGAVCQPKPPVCGDGEELVGGVCQPKPPVCGEDEELVGGVCQPKPPVCGEGEELVGGVCQPIPLPDKPNPEQRAVLVRKPDDQLALLLETTEQFSGAIFA